MSLSAYAHRKVAYCEPLIFILSYNKHCQNSGEVTLRGADVPTIVYLRFGDVESPAQKCAKADYDKLALTK